MPRVPAALTAAAVLLSASGCALLDSSDAADAAQDFLTAFAAGDVKRAAALTDAPDSASRVLTGTRDALAPKKITANVRTDSTSTTDSTTVPYTLTWDFGHGRQWRYESEADLYEFDGDWRLRWAPSVLHPDLTSQQRLALRVDTPEQAPVLDRGGRPILRPRQVVSVVLHPDKAGKDLTKPARSLSRALKPFDADLTASAILRGAEAAARKKQTYLVAALREEHYAKAKAKIYDVGGVTFSKQERLLAEDKTWGSQVVPAIRGLAEDKVAGAAGWRVVTVDASGAESAELHAEQAKPGAAVHTTLSAKAQTAAENAVDAGRLPTALVAMDASSGELLAVAQNKKADAQGAISLAGRYPPGSTFKIASALAAMKQGKLTARSRVDCPSTTVIDGRLVPNEGRFKLGRVRFADAFARSCNTTFAEMAADMPAESLTDAARDLGVGADFEIPGLTTITGSAPPAENRIQRAENGFGQGTILASPFGMALMTATAKTGKTPVPSLVKGMRTKAKDLGEPVAKDHVMQLRTMMRKVVTHGTASKLAAHPGVHGKTGTAQYGDGRNSHGWFVGYSGDTAFAVLVVGGNSSAPAVEVADTFLASQ